MATITGSVIFLYHWCYVMAFLCLCLMQLSWKPKYVWLIMQLEVIHIYIIGWSVNYFNSIVINSSMCTMKMCINVGRIYKWRTKTGGLNIFLAELFFNIGFKVTSHPRCTIQISYVLFLFISGTHSLTAGDLWIAGSALVLITTAFSPWWSTWEWSIFTHKDVLSELFLSLCFLSISIFFSIFVMQKRCHQTWITSLEL